MFYFLPQTFKFSFKISIISVVLATVMIICSVWQWKRYNWKTGLVETYKQHSTSAPLPFPVQGRTKEDFEDLIHKRVSLEGDYDFSHQIIVTNRKNAYGPGHLLFTPLKLKGSDHYVMISRGFIPYEDIAPESWEKFNFTPYEKLDGVLQESKESRLFGPKNPTVGQGLPLQHKWFFPEISRMSRQLPYPVITSVFVQRIGGPPSGKYPEESISVRVPPSTHFGYMIEWALLAALTLAIGFLLQAFPRQNRINSANTEKSTRE